MKEHKELKISFDEVEDKIVNPQLKGQWEDLVAVLSCGNEDFFKHTMSAALKYYLTCSQREDFLVMFLEAAAEADRKLLQEMYDTTIKS